MNTCHFSEMNTWRWILVTISENVKFMLFKIKVIEVTISFLVEFFSDLLFCRLESKAWFLLLVLSQCVTISYLSFVNMCKPFYTDLKFSFNSMFKHFLKQRPLHIIVWCLFMVLIPSFCWADKVWNVLFGSI